MAVAQFFVVFFTFPETKGITLDAVQKVLHIDLAGDSATIGSPSRAREIYK